MKLNRTRLRSALPSVTLALLVCFTSYAAPRTASRIGVIVPLSGSLAEYGQAIQNGVTLLLEDIKTDPARVAWEDSKGDTKNAVTAFKKLAATENVNAVFGWGATPSEAIAPIAEENKLPFVAASVSPSLAKDRKFVVRSVSPSTALVALLAEELKRSKAEKVMLLTAEWTYTEELSRALKSALGESLSVSEMTFNREDQDFKTAISKIRSGSFDTVGVLLSTGQISSFYRQLGSANLKVATFGSDFFSSKKEIAESGTAIENAFFPNLAVCPDFSDRYLARFGNDTHIAYAVNAYDMLRVLLTESETHPGYEPLMLALGSQQQRNGVCGAFQFKQDPAIGGYFAYPVKLYQVMNGTAQLSKN